METTTTEEKALIARVRESVLDGWSWDISCSRAGLTRDAARKRVKSHPEWAELYRVFRNMAEMRRLVRYSLHDIGRIYSVAPKRDAVNGGENGS